MISETFSNNVTVSLEGKRGKDQINSSFSPSEPSILSWREKALYCGASFGVLVERLLKD